MSTELLVSRRRAPRAMAMRAMEADGSPEPGLPIKDRLPHADLVAGDRAEAEDLEAQGYRVKRMPDVNVLRVGAFGIDTEGPQPEARVAAAAVWAPESDDGATAAPALPALARPGAPVPRGLDVPAALARTWRHHLVQLAGPRTGAWVRAIEERGVDVVEPVSGYGLFVVADPEAVAGLRELPFVRWVGPFKPAYRIAPNLLGSRGILRYVSIGVYPQDEVEPTRRALVAADAEVVREMPPSEGYRGEYTRLTVVVEARHLRRLARLPGVRWLEFASPEPELDGERELQLLAENFASGGNPSAAPIPGYRAWLEGLSLSGEGVTIAICDTGVGVNGANNTDGHLDLRGRQAAFVDYSGGATTTDTKGHGTHVAGIAVGSGATGAVEGEAPNDFLRGQGVAPAARYVTQNALMGPWPPVDWGALAAAALRHGAQILNNSWADGGPAGSGYTAVARRFDQIVRDPDGTAAALDHLIIVFSAGNDGGEPRTITPPKEAKNVLVVGNSLGGRSDGFSSSAIRGIYGSSSRGPAIDGRILPHVVAPGTDVSAALAGTPDGHTLKTGTSMAAPHVAGACALLCQWWSARTGGARLSPAMAKALLINTAEDLAGGENWRVIAGFTRHEGRIYRRDRLGFAAAAVVEQNRATGAFRRLTGVASLPELTAAGQWFYDAVTDALYVRTSASNHPTTSNRIHVLDAQPLVAIPNSDQGWGRVSLRRLLRDAPDSDGGPRFFSDQEHLLTETGQEHLFRAAPAETERPLRVTLAWTDAPGAVSSPPALVNDLDLEVVELETGSVYKGNVFADGFSVVGGDFDHLNNVECVYIRRPQGEYEISVIAGKLSANARPPFDNQPQQDFALVIDNAAIL